LSEKLFRPKVIHIKSPIQGAYAEVFVGKWSNQKVAVKRLRIDPRSDQLKQLKLETSLAISFFHPNMVRFYGSTLLEGGYHGIVMELADQGSLRDKGKTLTLDQKVRVGLCICDGLTYLHAKQVAHRDLKPDNILLFGSDPVAKITDFGTSKVIQTLITNTSMAGTPKYSAPELLDVGISYGSSVDIFSLAMVLYELFSDQDPFPHCQTLAQVVMAMFKDERPAFPAKFPAQLKEVVQKGWSKAPQDRPGIPAFRQELQKMTANPANESVMTTRSTVFSVTEQMQEISLASSPVPLISMKWSPASDTERTPGLRSKMVDNVKTLTSFRSMIAPSILKSMEVVPRHLFFETNRIQGVSIAEKIENSYAHNKAMGATLWSNESSPEIIAVQVPILQIFVTYTFHTYLTFNQYSLVGHFCNNFVPIF
jgi:serine/threonine protein kinase